MGRRSPRRMWHTVAALVPLPLIGLGVLAAIPSNPVAFQVELYLSSNGSTHALTHAADASRSQQALPGDAAPLFWSGEKGPRADHYFAAKSVTDAGKQRISASLGGEPGVTGALVSRSDLKGDRLVATTTDVALKRPADGETANSLFMNASFGPSFDVDAFKPSPEEIAYRPTSEALNFRYHGESQAEFEDRERRCLATAIYFEARGEPVRGQVAVGQVILNRVRSPLFPQTICGVVYQGQMQPGCQFSFTCDGKTDVPRETDQWEQAQDIAKKIMSGELWLSEVGYSTYYHANYVSPYWAGGMNKIDKIGRHIFYKKRNEKPYVVEASAGAAGSEGEAEDQGFSLTPTLSVVSAVSALAGSSASPTPAMSLGFAGSE
jgi:spore germination cell wall hydrolase CwlJ-like protein